MTKLYLIRHAQSQGNILSYFSGKTDSDLSQTGMLQLEQLKERFKHIDYDSIYSSPLKRAYKTAQAVNYYHGLPIVTNDGLIEIDGGHWEEKHWDDIAKLYPDENETWEKKPWLFAPLLGENMRHVYSRIWDTIISIIEKNKGKTVVITSHGCAIRNFACHAMGFGIEKLNEVEWFENTSVSTFEFDDNMSITKTLLNDSSHLKGEAEELSKKTWWHKGKK